MVPSSDFVMMASLEDSTTALNSRSRSEAVALGGGLPAQGRQQAGEAGLQAHVSMSSTASTKLAAQRP